MSEKIVFIAHSYHKKTKSYDFIVDYLSDFYDVEVVFDEEWETGKKIDWSQFSDYHAVIIWQMFPEDGSIKNLKNPNIIFFPMYDQAKRWNFSQWYSCKNIKIVSFSSTLHKKLKKWGFNSIYVQFFPEPREFTPGAQDEVFFWQRFTKININTVKKLLKNSDVKIHVHKAVDPGHEFVQPSEEDEKKFSITYSEWFETRAEMEHFMQSKGIYIAPRYFEGIGVSILEAMAQGKLIIANNKPTMNEYIKHGKTGLLCDFKFPKPLKLSNIKEIQKNAYEYIQKGYETWLVERKNIVDYINQPSTENELRLWVRVFKPFLSIDRKKIIRIKFGRNASFILFGIKVF